MESGDETPAPRSLLPLPRRAEDTSSAYEKCLAVLIDLLGAERPPLASDTGRSHRVWHQRARQVIAQAAQSSPARDEWFEPLMRAAVYDPDPSFNRRLIEPAVTTFGRRRVQRALLDYLRAGTDPERAGAARAWYWTQVPLTFLAGSPTPTPESRAEFEAVADLRQEWRETALRVFVANNDLDVRRSLLSGLNLNLRHYPEALHETVAEAVRIARTHPDDYLRHRVEHQV